MGHPVDPKKWSTWRRRLKRFEGSESSIARFCGSEGISEASFYLWRKKIAAADAAVPRPTLGAAGDKLFAPVTLVGAAPLVAELPGGTRLQVPTADLRLLRAAIDAIASADARMNEGGSQC
jgi:hypothetical protein